MSKPEPKAKPLPSRVVPASVMKMMAPRLAKPKCNTSQIKPDVYEKTEVYPLKPELGEDRPRKRRRGWEDVQPVLPGIANIKSSFTAPIALPNEFNVTLDMTGNTLLGINVDWTDGKTLYIKSVNSGAIDVWNQTHAPEQIVRAGDRIVAVNGHVGDTQAMVRECRAQGRLRLLVRAHDQVVTTSQKPKIAPVDLQKVVTIDDDPLANRSQYSTGDSLYAGMPAPDPEKDKHAGSRAREHDIFADPPAAEDKRLVVFLDIDGVLRKLGDCPTISVDGELLPLSVQSRAFAPEAARALKFLIHRTGANIVLSSEWRRAASLREEVATTFRALGLPALRGMTVVLEPRDDVFVGIPAAPEKEATLRLRWAERRAREVSLWLREHTDVERWVALDDLDLSRADDRQVKLADSFRMAAGLVLVDPEIGLTLSNARVAVEMLSRGIRPLASMAPTTTSALDNTSMEV